MVVDICRVLCVCCVVGAVDKESQQCCSHRADDARHEVAAAGVEMAHPRSRVNPEIGVGFGVSNRN